MYILPSKKKQFIQGNLSDNDPSSNIYYTKNMNFDETGYAKLSSRSVSIVSQEEKANFGYPFSLGRASLNGAMWIVSYLHTFVLSLTDNNISITDEGTGTNIPSGTSINKRGKWWQNKWHVSYDTGVKVKDGVTGVWTDGVPALSLNFAYYHPLEVFKSLTTLCVGDGNKVHQYNSDYSAGIADLVIPTDYNVVDLAFNSDQMGVATMMDVTLIGQNQEAMFYLWDGKFGFANEGYPVGSDSIISVKPYKSSWVILTRNGKIKYFNGGGFDDLVTLPFFFKHYTITQIQSLGDIMHVEGDLIYLNVPADVNYYGIKQQRFMQNFVGGVLCFDPKVGLYHRYSASISKATFTKITSAAVQVNLTTNVITTDVANPVPVTGNPIMFLSGNIGGITLGKVYYVIRLTHNAITGVDTFALANTASDANAGNRISFTSTGSGVQGFFGLTVLDYGLSKGTYSMAVTSMGNQDFFYDHLMFGGLYTNISGTDEPNLCITVPMFPNRGYIVTQKTESNGMSDNSQKIFVKFKPLKVGDEILVKIKKDDRVNIPVSTPQLGITCTWLSSTQLQTTADISEVVSYLSQDSEHECECEIINGAGGGQMPQITSISLSGATYTINLAEAVDGVTNGNLCNIIIDSWKLYGSVDYTNTDNYVEFPITKVSKWTMAKIEVRGVEVAIEQALIINAESIPAR